MSEIVDKTDEQKEAEAEVEEFREELGPFVVAAEETRMPMVFTDAKEPDHPIIFANDSFLKLTGYGREEVLGQAFAFLIDGNAESRTLPDLAAQFEESSECSAEIPCFRKDGSKFWAGIFVSPVHDAAGEIVQYFASFVDLTRHKDAQAQSRMLIDELNHRVKNTLSTVQSIVSQALRNAADPEAIRDAIESRLQALSRSHDLLTLENWESAGLLDIIKSAMEPFGVANGRAERFVIKGQNVGFPPKAALALGIAFHELATNAVKYGAFSDEAGCITIAWTIEPRAGGNRLVLQWREQDGPPVTRPSRKGFGSRVIERGLAHELDGTVTLEYPRDGVVCTIDIPAPRGALDE